MSAATEEEEKILYTFVILKDKLALTREHMNILFEYAYR